MPLTSGFASRTRVKTPRHRPVMDAVFKYNPNHDQKGLFASGSSSGASDAPHGGLTKDQFLAARAARDKEHDNGKKRPSDASAGGSTVSPLARTSLSSAAWANAFQYDAYARPQADARVAGEADEYNAKIGLPPVRRGTYYEVDQQAQGRVADVYEALPNDTRATDPAVKKAYDAFSKEVDDQWDAAVAHGMKFIPWTDQNTQPYETTEAVVQDIKDRKLYYSVTGDKTMDRFLAIHDYYGHTAGGNGFGPRGEYNAWISHSQMFTPAARLAMTTRARGQNAWQNFGKHLYDKDGNWKNIPSAERPWAPLKYALLPPKLARVPGEPVKRFTTL